MSTLVLLQQYKFTALGPMYLSAMLKSKGHKCILLVEGLEKDILGSIRKIKPDLIGFQVFTEPASILRASISIISL